MSHRRALCCGGAAQWLHLLFVVLGLAGLGLVPAAHAQQKRTSSGELQWERLQNCVLLTNGFFDGDSFHVSSQGKEYTFRLYFVDAPETDNDFPERVADQASYFGIGVADVLKAAEVAKEFTRRWLAGRAFTVMTRWENARGQGAQARYYAVVLLGQENLAEALVTHGWARIHGERANLREGPSPAAFVARLEEREAVAKHEKRGLWNDRQFPRATAPTRTPVTRTTAPQATGLIDINRASKQELEALPGVGPKLAERIIAQRPYRKVEDLERVKGIGSKTMEKLRPLVTVKR